VVDGGDLRRISTARDGLIASPECRLPLCRVSEALAIELDRFDELVPA